MKIENKKTKSVKKWGKYTNKVEMKTNTIREQAKQHGGNGKTGQSMF